MICNNFDFTNTVSFCTEYGVVGATGRPHALWLDKDFVFGALMAP
jgi:hypothetical protein